jgi:hypothetical protein
VELNNRRKSMSLRHILAVAAMAASLTVAAGAGAAHAVPSHPDFAAQARGAHLSGAQAADLQRRVDSYLSRSGGTQVSINEIDLGAAGSILLTLPGMDRAREVNAAGRVAPAAAACNYYYFCAFSGPAPRPGCTTATAR